MENEKLESKSPENHSKRARRRIIIASIIFLVIIFLGVALYCWQQYQHYRVTTQTSTETSKFADIKFDTTVEWNDEYRLHVMYPVTGQAQLDAAAKAKIDKYVNEYRKLVAAKPQGSAPYELNILGTVNYASKDAVNFEYTGKWVIDNKTGNVTVNALFDRNSGKEVQTADLFKDSNYLQMASDAARKALPSILGAQSYDKTLVERGTTPDASHFDQFEIVDSKTIAIIFEPGQVADASLGIVKVPMGVDSFNSDLNEDIVGKIFPDYMAQVKAQEKKEADEKAAAEAAAKAAAEGTGAPALINGTDTDCSKVKCIALTFDDGPGAGTEVILDTLKEHKAHATFMVVGSRVASYANFIKREAAEGHDIGNHTWDHAELTNLSLPQAHDEVNRTAQAVVNVIGKRPFMVRPPYGAYNKALLSAINQPFILWSVDPDDWKDRDANIVYQRVMSAARPGAIVLSHDLYTTTAAAYQRIIPDLIKQGYTLVTVSDLLDLDPSHPAVGVYSQR